MGACGKRKTQKQGVRILSFTLRRWEDGGGLLASDGQTLNSAASAGHVNGRGATRCSRRLHGSFMW